MSGLVLRSSSMSLRRKGTSLNAKKVGISQDVNIKAYFQLMGRYKVMSILASEIWSKLH